MVWARLDDQFPQHKKVWPRSDAAFRLHVAGICHSSWLLLDGVIDDARVAGLVPHYKPRALRELVDAGIWHAPGHGCVDCPQPPEGAYIIHDFLDANPSEKKVKDEREARAERQRKWREKKAAEKTAREALRDASRNGQRDASRNAAPAQDPARPGPKGLGSGRGERLLIEIEPTAAEGDERPDRFLPPEEAERNVERARGARSLLHPVPGDAAGGDRDR
jgi:hypothetical protein